MVNNITFKEIYEQVYKDGALLIDNSVIIDFFTSLLPAQLPDFISKQELEQLSNLYPQFFFFEFNFNSITNEFSILKNLIPPTFIFINKQNNKIATLRGQISKESFQTFLEKNK